MRRCLMHRFAPKQQDASVGFMSPLDAEGLIRTIIEAPSREKPNGLDVKTPAHDLACLSVAFPTLPSTVTASRFDRR